MLTRRSIDLPSGTEPQILPALTLLERVMQLESALTYERQERRGLLDALAAWQDQLNSEGVLQIADATIDGTPIGSDAPDTGAFTTLDVGTSSTFPTTSTTPTPTASAGVFTTVSAAVRVTSVGDRRIFTCIVTITTNGTAAGYIIVPMPFTAAEVTAVAGVSASSGLALAALVSGANLLIYKYDATYPGGDGVTLQLSGVFRV